jgi:hypothetical protein
MERLQRHRFYNSDVVYPPPVYPRYQTTPADSVGSTSAPPPSASASEEVTSRPDTKAITYLPFKMTMVHPRSTHRCK